MRLIQKATSSLCSFEVLCQHLHTVKMPRFPKRIPSCTTFDRSRRDLYKATSSLCTFEVLGTELSLGTTMTETDYCPFISTYGVPFPNTHYKMINKRDRPMRSQSQWNTTCVVVYTTYVRPYVWSTSLVLVTIIPYKKCNVLQLSLYD